MPTRTHILTPNRVRRQLRRADALVTMQGFFKKNMYIGREKEKIYGHESPREPPRFTYAVNADTRDASIRNR